MYHEPENEYEYHGSDRRPIPKPEAILRRHSIARSGAIAPFIPIGFMPDNASLRTNRGKRRAMDKTVVDLNIEHYKKLLATETEPTKRQTIQRLLAEEEAKLALAQANKTRKPCKT
jgi:hypothetical protein